MEAKICPILTQAVVTRAKPQPYPANGLPRDGGTYIEVGRTNDGVADYVRAVACLEVACALYNRRGPIYSGCGLVTQ